MNGPMEIGFSQRVRLEWFERTAELVRAGANRDEIKKDLDEMLSDRLSVGSNAERGNRDKAISVLLKCWLPASDGVQPLRGSGLELIAQFPGESRLPFHWGMAMAAYPFFGAVAETTGRLLRLQSAVSAAQVQRRLREQFGERETVARAARRVLRSFGDWGVLRDTATKGVYQAAPARQLREAGQVTWLLEATMRATGSNSASLAALFRSPALFPFELASIGAGVIRGTPRLELVRQGLDQEVMMLRG